MISECKNGGFVAKFFVSPHEVEQIEQFTGKYIKIVIEKITLVALLKSVKSKTLKDKVTKEEDIYFEITVEIEKILGNKTDNTYVPLLILPDKKDEIVHSVDFVYGKTEED